MAALPNGRVGGGARASSSLRSRPHGWTGRRLPELARDTAARPRVPPRYSVLLWVRALQPSAPAAPGRQSLADGRAETAADLSLCPSAWFCCCRRGRQVPPHPRAVLCYFTTTPLPQHCHWRVWAKPPLFRLHWRNVPGTRRNERTGVGLHGNWKKEVGYKSFATLL